jgi:hypothetical protein
MELAQHLRALEEQLLITAVRTKARAVSALLAEDFQEYGSSGRVYSKAEILAALQEEPPVQVSLHDFHAVQLAESVVHVTYRSVREVHGAPPIQALRSSLWVARQGRWQILFHQGTRMPVVDSVGERKQASL